LAARAQDLLDRDQVVDARLQGRVTIHRPIKGPDNDARWVYLELAGANVPVHRGHAHRALVILIHLRLTVGQRRRVSVVVNDLQLLLPYRDDVDESVQSTLDAPDWLVQRLPVPYAQYDRTIFAHEAPAVRLHHLGPEPDLGEVVPDRLLEPRLLLHWALRAISGPLEQPRRILPRLAYRLVHRGLGETVPRVHVVHEVEGHFLRV